MELVHNPKLRNVYNIQLREVASRFLFAHGTSPTSQCIDVAAAVDEQLGDEQVTVGVLAVDGIRRDVVQRTAVLSVLDRTVGALADQVLDLIDELWRDRTAAGRAQQRHPCA